MELTLFQAEGYRMHLRQNFVKDGKGRIEAWRLTRGLSRDEIADSLDAAVALVPGAVLPDLPTELAAGAVGASFDGHILKAIFDAIDQFSKTPFGQAVIAALEQIILHMLIP